MPGLYSHTTRATGTVLTASIYNTDHQNHIDNLIPSMIDDQSSNVAAMQATTSPGGVGTESLATDLQGELERLRYVIQTIHGGAQWYPGAAAPSTSAANTWTAAQTLQSTDAGATAQTLLILDRFSASPANADNLIAIVFRGRDDGANSIDWVKEFGTIVNVSAAAKASQKEWQTYVSNSLATRMTLAAGLLIGSATGGDQGTGTINASAIYDDGAQILPPQIALYQNQQTSGTNGPTYTNGAWRTVTLNTEVFDASSIGSLASDQVTLGAGSYEAHWDVAATRTSNTSSGRTRLYNATDASVIVQGINRCGSGSSVGGDDTGGSGHAYFTLAGSKAIELQFYTLLTTSTNTAVSSGEAEVYAQLYIRKVG